MGIEKNKIKNNRDGDVKAASSSPGLEKNKKKLRTLRKNKKRKFPNQTPPKVIYS